MVMKRRRVCVVLVDRANYGRMKAGDDGDGGAAGAGDGGGGGGNHGS
jgi:hypothetical protein